ncbi:hypothetical protein SESBI_10074 [Sesbania bispinosa]|nr:hypothetical protein SESBI_10074 [Sesbania bispinosa]
MESQAGNIVTSETQQEEELTVELECDDIQSFQLASRSLVGKIFSSKILNKGAVKNILMKAWKCPNEVQITDMGINRFLFTFLTKDEAKVVLDKGLWVPFWIQLHGLPLEMMSTTNAAKILGKIGEVQEVDNPFVGRHEQKNCKLEKIMESSSSSTPKFSPKLGVPPAKAITILMKEQGLWKKASTSSMEDKAENKDEEKEEAKGQGQDVGDTATKGDHKAAKKHKWGPVSPQALLLPLLLLLPLIRLSLNPDPTTFHKSPLEHVNFKSPSVTTIDLSEDYPSPKQNKYEGAMLAQEQIRKCRKAIGKEHSELGYFVEFPEDDSDTKDYSKKVNSSTLQAEDENTVIVGWNSPLSLKRKRSPDVVVIAEDILPEHAPKIPRKEKPLEQP